MSMKSKLESAYAKALTGTFKVINPIKKTIKKTEWGSIYHRERRSKLFLWNDGNTYSTNGIGSREWGVVDDRKGFPV